MSAPLRAADAPGVQRLRFGDFELDLSAQRLLRNGRAVPLPPRHFALLVHLAGSGGRLVGKDELLDAVWGHRHVSDSVLKVAINALRAALGDDPKLPRHVETVPRRGYRFIGVEPVAPDPTPPLVPSTPTTPSTPPRPAPPPTPSTAPARGNLPPPQPGLIGRDADLQRLHEALAGQRLVTLHGPGGVGKTRLALAAAGHDAPADGVWLLRLDVLDSAAPLLGTVARTLGLGPGAEASPAALARAVGGQRLRLVLDNAEHLQAAVADLAAALLAGAPDVQLLVTSQVPLHVAGEQVLPLQPLALPDAQPAPGQPAAALQLLLQRVRQQAPDLPFDGADAADAAAICRGLDGLPLALELAAARVPLLGWAGVRARLDERLKLLTRGARDAAGRHRTLRAALAWTHGLLRPREQQVLAALSVFAGSFTLDSALAVAAGDEQANFDTDTDTAVDVLDSLRDRSLLVRVGDGGAPRWRLYDSVRSFAAETLSAGPLADAVQRRLVQHLIALFTRADADHATTPVRVWLARWEPEAHNLRAALQVALGRDDLREDAARLYAISADFCQRSGWRRAVMQDHQQVAAWVATMPADVQAAFDLAHAQLSSIGQLLPPRPALQAAQRAEAYYAQAGDVRRQHLAMYQASGLLLRLQAPPEERAAVLARMRAIEPADWGPLQRRNRLWQEVLLAGAQGDMALFEDRCAAYMATGRALGDESAAWLASQALAQAMAGQQRMDTALALLARTVHEMRACGELRRNAHVLAQWASLKLLHDAGADTVAAVQEAAQLMHADERLWWMADALAWLPAWQGRWADAVRVQAWADDLVRQRGDLRGKLFGAVRSRFAERLAALPDAARWQAALQQPHDLDEAAVLALVFGPGASAPG